MWVQSFGKICNLWPEFFRWKMSKTWKNSGGGWVTRVGTTPMWAAQSHVVAWDAFHNITHPFCVEKATRHECRIVHVWRWKVLLHCTTVQMSSIYLVTFVYRTCLEIRRLHSKSWRRLCTASTLFQIWTLISWPGVPEHLFNFHSWRFVLIWGVVLCCGKCKLKKRIRNVIDKS